MQNFWIKILSFLSASFLPISCSFCPASLGTTNLAFPGVPTQD